MKTYEEFHFEAAALRALRLALGKLGITTVPCTDDQEWFRAFVHRDPMGQPWGGLLIVTHNPGAGGARAQFSWSRHGKHPMTDVVGAARKIAQIIGEQKISERLIAAELEGAHTAWVIWWSKPARRFWALPRWTGLEAAMVDATDPRELVARMRQIERQIPI